MNEHENVIERARHTIFMSGRIGGTQHSAECARNLHAAGLLVTQDHIDALKACEEYAAWLRDYVPIGIVQRACYNIGKRSLAAKAAAVEASADAAVELVKRIWKESRKGKHTLTELAAALDALAEEGE